MRKKLTIHNHHNFYFEFWVYISHFCFLFPPWNLKMWLQLLSSQVILCEIFTNVNVFFFFSFCSSEFFSHNSVQNKIHIQIQILRFLKTFWSGELWVNLTLHFSSKDCKLTSELWVYRRRKNSALWEINSELLERSHYLLILLFIKFS